eukprot:gene33804-43578_t
MDYASQRVNILGEVWRWSGFGLRLLKRDMRDCTYTNNRSSMLQVRTIVRLKLVLEE